MGSEMTPAECKQVEATGNSARGLQGGFAVSLGVCHVAQYTDCLIFSTVFTAGTKGTIKSKENKWVW